MPKLKLTIVNMLADVQIGNIYGAFSCVFQLYQKKLGKNMLAKQEMGYIGRYRWGKGKK
jgi:hypothetical protein